MTTVRRPAFDGQTVLVTGAASGLGRALALGFAAAGARVVALDRDSAGLESLRAELESLGRDGLALSCDITDAAACERAIAAGVEHFGRLDVLVNNAGVSHRSAFARTDLAVIRRVMEVNFFGAVNCTRAALPALVARTGYAASKHAMHGFFESLRAELAPRGVAVTMVCPSFIATRIDRNALGGDGGPVRHAQVTVGTPLTAEAAAARIVAAAPNRPRMLFVGRTARQAWWLSRIAPGLYERIMARRLAAEMDPP